MGAAACAWIFAPAKPIGYNCPLRGGGCCPVTLRDWKSYTLTVLARQRKKILASMAFAILVYAIFLGIGDYNKLSQVLRDFPWGLLPFILFFSAFNYGLRFIKWQFYLRLVGVRGLAWSD